MEIVRIAAAGLVSAVLALAIKKEAPQFSVVLSLAASALIFFMALPMLADKMIALFDLARYVRADMAYITIIFRIIGIAYIAEFASQVCSDAGEGAIAQRIAMAAKVLIMSVSVPVLMSLVDIIDTMLP
ncbi:MAG: stage III sporulation protein AD [Defluviitaleaceae bacterium]|nr:stage III sporulation protein AD [Defluviitaleaceae bacterium]